MRPLIIKFQAFGPYKNEEIVDFEALSRQGLFLICGETGSGKTTILDAMTFALFGKSSGGMRDQLEAMRCKQSKWGTDTYVSYDFELHQKVYRFERKLECKKVKLSASQNVYVKNEDGYFEPIFENCKEKDINAKAKELLGLDYEQFRQVIILPQGQFEKLLTSNSDEKEKILVSIFGVNKWQKIANYFYEHASETRNKLLKTKEQVELRLADEGCRSLEEFASQIERLQEELIQIQKEFQAQDYEKKKRELDEKREIGRQFSAMHALEKKYVGLEEKEIYFDTQKYRMQRAQQAETVKPVLETFVILQKEALEREKKYIFLTREIENAQGNAERAKQELEKHLAKKAQMDALGEAIIRLEEKRPYYEGIQIKKDNYEKEKAVYAKLNSEKIKQQLVCKTAEERLQKATEAYQNAYQSYTWYSQQFISGITGTLAAKLQEGDACPVCGSTVHPKKAEAIEMSVSEDEVKERESAMRNCFDVLSKSQRERNEALKKREEQEARCLEQEGLLAMAKAELQNATENLSEEIADLASLNQKIHEHRRRLHEYQVITEKLEQAAKEKADKFAEMRTKAYLAKEEVDNSLEKLNKQQKALEVTLEQSGFASKEEAKQAMMTEKEIQKMREEISNFHAELKHIGMELEKSREALKEIDEPDLNVIEQERKVFEQQKERYLSACARMDLAIRQKQEKFAALQKKALEYESAWAQAESDWAIAKNLRGDTGIGLQRYVLGIMFSSVIVAANKMLEKVHGGRYRLFRTDEKSQGSNKKGLELKVFDSFSQEGDDGRSVKTLSGGEKFLVSLALSIGMSTVAQKSGTHLDAMFVDEGFGSLDQNSIEDALEILAGIQKANGTVGIISHVQVLQDNIPTKLEIQKSRDGSRIVMNIG